MEETTHTGLMDKTGRHIYVGDIVQYRLGKFGKSGGSKNLKVIQFGKKYHLVEQSQVENGYGGILLTQKLCENIVVIKSDHIRV